MNDIERLIAGFEYVSHPDKISADIQEFISTLTVICGLLSDKNEIDKMLPSDLTGFLVSMKNFNDEIKPIAIKYGILPNILGGDKK